MYLCWSEWINIYLSIGLLKDIFFFFFLRIIAFQYCVGFCHTSTRISHRYTYVPSLVDAPPIAHPTPPLWVATGHQVDLPGSHSKLALAICLPCGNVHASAPSQLIPPSPHGSQFLLLFILFNLFNIYVSGVFKILYG